jgi:6-pyruvoyltetrahydropterin/6-carboxytetrahydropterin synthase
VQEGNQGHLWDCFVTVHGTIDPITGMVTDIGALDRLVQEKVVKAFDQQNLQQVLGAQQVTGETLAKTVWERLFSSIKGGKLERVRLVQTRDLVFEYAGYL